MRRLSLAALALLASSCGVFDTIGNAECADSPGYCAASTGPCKTDPAVDCAGICVVVEDADDMPAASGAPVPTSACSDADGPQTQQFLAELATYACDPTMYGMSYVVFPTAVDLNPALASGSTACTVPPAPPSTMSFAQFVGGE